MGPLFQNPKPWLVRDPLPMKSWCSFWAFTVMALPLVAQQPAAEEPMSEALAALIELMETPVLMASNIVSNRHKQPVSVTTIQRSLIESSGARNLMEVLNLYVPGFFHTEHQEESILAFRGMAPDNNSKVMFMMNGHVLNTEWFLGAPDGILQSLDTDYIERIDVIRGPGSVTMGQGALLGVINVVTKGNTLHRTSMVGGLGKDGLYYGALEAGLISGTFKTYFHVADFRYKGQDLRPEGNATRAWEGSGSGRIHDHMRLKRSNGLTVLANLSYQGTGLFELQFIHNDVNRDMYNFRRDRAQYQQILDSISATYQYDINQDHSLKAKLGLDQDEYILHSPQGFVMGGTREYRTSLSLLYTGRLGSLNVAAGLEEKRYKMGITNRNGHNFLAQVVETSMLVDPNATKTMVYPAQIEVQGLFAEAFYEIGERWNAFIAFRYDKHPYWGRNGTPRVGVLFNPSDEWRFRLAYQTGFRGAPGMHYAGGYRGDGLLREENFDKVLAATQGNVSNIDKVQPEKMKSLELEANYSPMKNLHFNLVLFRNHMDKMITFNYFWTDQAWLPKTIGSDKVGDWGGCWWFVNTKGALTTHGAEGSLKYTHPWADVTFSHSMVRLSSVDDSVYEIPTQYIVDKSQGKHFGTYPEDVTRLSLTLFPQNPWTGTLSLLHYGKWYAPNKPDSGKDVQSPGQTLMNLGASLKLFEGLSLQVSVNNLLDSRKLYPFDDKAQGDPSVMQPGTPFVEGRTFWAKLKYIF